MAQLQYNLERLQKCIFSLYEDINSPEDIINYWNISEDAISKAWGELVIGKALIGGTPSCRVRMIDMFLWEVIVDPPVDDDYSPLWGSAPDNEIEFIKDGKDLCAFLLIFAIENGAPTQFITDDETLLYKP